MVIDSIKKAFSNNDEKYEALYYKFSKIKLQNEKLKSQHEEDMKKYRNDVQKKMALHLMNVYDAIEDAKNSSFKVTATDKDIQRLLMDINKSEKALKEVMRDINMEEIKPSERYYDPELHEIASSQPNDGMAKGLIMKTVKKGIKFKGEYLRKPRVVVTK